MGVPKFYGEWIQRKNHELNSILQNGVPPLVSSLLLDMNGIIHDMASIVYSYGDNYNEPRAKLVAAANPVHLEVELFNAIGTKILQILTQVQPRDTIVLAVDGVAPYGKINQQRQRRFRAAAERTKTSVFDSNAITPGTDLMRNLDNYLKRWISTNEYALPPKVIYSSHMVPGEGEHKIMDFIRKGEIYSDGEGAHVLYGLDADLVMLSLVAPLDKIHLMREDINDVVSIDNLKYFISKEMNTTSAIDDFVFLLFFIGNDFLPHMPSLEDLSYAIDTLIHVYKAAGKSLIDNGNIIWDNLVYYLATLASVEEQLIEHEASRNVKYPSRMIEAATTTIQSISERPDTSVSSVISVKRTLNFDTFRSAWYSNALGPKGNTDIATFLLGEQPYQITSDRIINMCTDYLRGLAWVNSYYRGGIENINIEWSYLYHYTPLIVDLAAVAQSLTGIDGYEPVEGQTALNSVYQLLAVLPISSKQLLPVEVQKLSGTNSPIADLYPLDFKVELDGKTSDWQGIAILPFADIPRIIETVNTYVIFPPERATLFEVDNNVIIERNPELTNLLEQKQKVRQFLSAPRGRGVSRGRGRGQQFPTQRGRGRGRGTYQFPRGRGVREQGQGFGRRQNTETQDWKNMNLLL